MATTFDLNLDDYKYGFHEEENYVFKAEKGLNEDDCSQDFGDEK